MDQRVICNFFVETIQFLLSGEFSVKEKINDFYKTGVVSQLLNGIAPIAQDTLFTADIGCLLYTSDAADE